MTVCLTKKVRIVEYFPIDEVKRDYIGDSYEVHCISKDTNKYKKSLANFVRYYKNLMRLYKEEGIVTVNASFLYRGTAYAILDYYEYKTLESLCETNKLNTENVLGIFEKVLYIVKKIKSIGLNCGLIQLRNIYIKDNDIMVGDFLGYVYDEYDDLWELVYFLASLINSDDQLEEKNIIKSIESLKGKLSERRILLLKKVLYEDSIDFVDFCNSFNNIREYHIDFENVGIKSSNISIINIVRYIVFFILVSLIAFFVVLNVPKKEDISKSKSTSSVSIEKTKNIK